VSIELDSPLTSLSGVGPALSNKLEKLNLFRVEDLLFLLPLRYEDRTQLRKIGSVRAGERVLISGAVLLAETVYRGRRSLLVRVSDSTGQVTLRFFHFSNAQRDQFRTGMQVSCFGEMRRGPAGLEMVHPEYRLLRAGAEAETTDSLTPVYPATDGVQQGRLRTLTSQALDVLAEHPPEELLPDTVRRRLQMPTLSEAIRFLHRPPPDADVIALKSGAHPCQKRLAFEELLAHYLSLRAVRASANRYPAPRLNANASSVDAFLDSLPFTLTGAQQRVVADVRRDVASGHPMMRLVQGDVGSGKTVVAAIACLYAVSSGLQAAIMAPTELLAEQHFAAFTRWFEPLGITPVWLSGSQKARDRKASNDAIAGGSAKVIVGTHALFQTSVEFHSLGLVVIDEQHRFGVHQRMALRDKGNPEIGQPHQLVMTATPIPRTLAMAAYADLDTSVIDELPPGRQPVGTIAVSDTRRDEIVERVRAACVAGQQAYWVCPLIEESEALEAEAAEATYAWLGEQLSELRVGLVHGRMKAAEKERGMRAFKDGTIQLLVATTVIEVGVDVPNATLMIIENAERMGLSQLHQLRGRVGRGSGQSHCVLMYKPPLGAMAKKRLSVLRDSNDGFVIAQRDLELRGPGELLGTRQTGLPDYRIADLTRDADLMPRVQSAAGTLAEHPETANAITRRWLGLAERYAKV